MKAADGRLLFSPSDLGAYLECEHLTALSREVALGLREKPELAPDPYGELMARKGDEHERAFLETLRAEGCEVVEIELGEQLDFAAGARATEEAMRACAPMIYQAVLVLDGWRGLADFLERIERPSALGPWSYEVLDTKLARRPKPAHVLQLCFYSQAVGRIQGVAPEEMHVVLGTRERASFRLADFAAYHRRVRRGFLAAVESGRETEPYPVDHCGYCDFRPECEARWRAEDHLVQVAGVYRLQVKRLRAAGLPTLAALAAAPEGTKVPKLREEIFAGLREQAALQLLRRETGRLERRHKALEPGRGFERLPRPSPGDLVLDLEGDPFWEPARGLDFLFGVLECESGSYRAIWAHDREGERRALETFVDLVRERLSLWPDLHVYHYGTYDSSAVKRLMGEYGTREAEVDELLRREVFVDLLTVLRQAMRAGVPSYSLKLVEELAGFRRSAEMRAGAEAVLDYEQWLETRDSSLLSGIEAYNEEDCRATLAVRDWLVSDRPADLPWPEPPAVRELPEEAVEAIAAHEALRRALVEGEEEGSPRRLAGELLEYHRREARPAWWWFFERLGMSAEELLEDPESIGGLERVPGVAPESLRKSLVHTLSFPEQELRLGPGEAFDPATGKGAGTILEVDAAAGRLTLLRGPSLEDVPLPKALVPGGPYDVRYQRAALARLAESIRDGTGRYPALEGILARELPRVRGRAPGARIQTTGLAEMRKLALKLDGSHLFVQGPPGSGKTYTGARLVVHLLREGKSVGVASGSHKAIHNLLGEVEAAAREEGVRFRGLKKASEGNDESVYEGAFIASETRIEPFAEREPDLLLVAGTAWLFAREPMDSTLDYLFVDEAGQVSLADALAIGTAARNVVLLGDPLQLAQVSQGTHPPGTGVSVLEHLLGEWPTIPADRGLFLEESWRMHPDVCSFISEIVYDARLGSAEEARRRTTGAGTGVRFLPVEHEGNRIASLEEVERVAVAAAGLAGVPFTEADGTTRPLRHEDFMVVAPYNAQVRALRKGLPEGVRVGTVDKFQGQQAPVVFFSMATSSGEDVPRNLEFLFSRNRLNVAISRAQCLAYLVCAPRLLEARTRSIEQMKLVNALCRFVEVAES